MDPFCNFMYLICHVFCLFHLVTCWVRAGPLNLLCVMFSCIFVNFPCGVLGQMWYLIELISDLCLLFLFFDSHLSLMYLL